MSEQNTEQQDREKLSYPHGTFEVDHHLRNDPQKMYAKMQLNLIVDFYIERFNLAIALLNEIRIKELDGEGEERFKGLFEAAVSLGIDDTERNHLNNKAAESMAVLLKK